MPALTPRFFEGEQVARRRQAAFGFDGIAMIGFPVFSIMMPSSFARNKTDLIRDLKAGWFLVLKTY